VQVIAEAAMSAGQQQKILHLLLDAHGRWVPAPALAAISLQYSARVRELRLDGCNIENRVVRGRDGAKHGYFRIRQWVTVADGQLTTTPARKPPERVTAPQGSLFGDLAKTHSDDG
jgi:hypothetical protein